MGHQIEFEDTVCGGFPVLVRATEYRENGMWFLEDFEILTIKGGAANFIVSKMTEKDWDELGNSK